MEPYDYFTPSSLVEALWTVSNSPGVNNLDERRTVTNGEFLVDARSWFSASLSLNVKNPAPVTALRSTVSIHGGTTRRCNTQGYDPVVVRASVGGRFFHAPGGDVGAFAEIEYTSDATAIAVSKYRVQYCDDPECTTGAIIDSGALGLLTRKFPTATLLVEWDGAANQFTSGSTSNRPRSCLTRSTTISLRSSTSKRLTGIAESSHVSTTRGPVGSPVCHLR
jgi:hypothetical protein